MLKRVPEVQKGVFTYFVWRTTPRLGDALELLEGLRHLRALQSLEVSSHTVRAPQNFGSILGGHLRFEECQLLRGRLIA